MSGASISRPNGQVSHGDEHHYHDLEYDHLVLSLGSVNEFLRKQRARGKRPDDEIARRCDSFSETT